MKYGKVRGASNYRVDRAGHIWSKWRGTWKRLKTTKRKDSGYYVATIYRDDGLVRVRTVHRMVLEAFVGPCPEGMECCHEDGDKSNNRLSNLYWGTHKENSDDSVRLNLTTKGTKNGMAKLSEFDVIEIRRLYRNGMKQRDIAKKYCVGQACISLVCLGKNWQHLNSVAPIIAGTTKGRYVGENSPASRLTEAEAKEIKKRRQAGEKLKILAREYGVSINAISMIGRGLSWSHLS